MEGCSSSREATVVCTRGTAYGFSSDPSPPRPLRRARPSTPTITRSVRTGAGPAMGGSLARSDSARWRAAVANTDDVCAPASSAACSWHDILRRNRPIASSTALMSTTWTVKVAERLWPCATCSRNQRAPVAVGGRISRTSAGPAAGRAAASSAERRACSKRGALAGCCLSPSSSSSSLIKSMKVLRDPPEVRRGALSKGVQDSNPWPLSKLEPHPIER
mmetsp:Transcript_5903/g.12411  ORF Transcript_5903/g.12411 Transcript_5903/m.12411 type:complete len:219 (-) Transcript_5903:249-905(-)